MRGITQINIELNYIIWNYPPSYMEVEYSGGGVLIFSYLILINQFEHFGGLIRVSSLAAALMARQ